MKSVTASPNLRSPAMTKEPRWLHTFSLVWPCHNNIFISLGRVVSATLVIVNNTAAC